MKKTQIVFIITLFLIMFQSIGQTSNDSVRLSLHVHSVLNQEQAVIDICKKRYYFFILSNPTKALKSAEYMQRFVTELNDSLQIAEMYFMQGEAHYQLRNNKHALENFFLALQISEIQRLDKLSALYRRKIADIYQNEKLDHEASKYYFKSLNYYISNNDEYGAAAIYRKLAYLQLGKKDSKKALDYSIRALEIFQKQENHKEIAIINTVLAQIYYNVSDTKTATKYLIKAQKYFDSKNDQINLAKIFHLYANMYFHEKKYKLAKIKYKEALNIYSKNNYEIQKIDLIIKLIETERRLKNENNAIKLAQEALEISYSLKLKSQKVKLLFILFQLYENNNNQSLTLRYLKNYSLEKDSLEKWHNILRITELKIGIETEKQRTKLIEAQNNFNLKELENRNQQKLIYLSISSLFFSLILLALLYNKYRARKKSIHELQHFVDATFEGIIIHEQGKILEVNQQLLDSTGYSNKEVKNKRIDMFFDKNQKKFISKLFSFEPISFFETKLLCADNSYLIVRIVEKKLKYNNKYVKVISIRDISDSKKTEQKLRDSIEKFRTLVENSPDGILITNLNGEFTYASSKLAEMFGYDNEEDIKQQDLSNLILEQKEQTKQTYLSKNLYLGMKEYLGVKKDGTFFYVESNGKIVRDDTGKAKALMHTIRDITYRKHLEKNLEESQLQFKLLFDKAQDAIIIENENEEIVNANPYAAKLFGYSLDELTQMKTYQLQESTKPSLNIYQTGKQEDRAFELPLKHKDGTIMFVQITLTPININGKKLFISIGRNITQQKQAERILKKSQKELLELNATKDKMFSIISHDLRSPIGTFKTILEYLTDNPNKLDSDKLNQILTSMKNSAGVTLNLLENLLFWAKSQQGSISYKPEKFSLCQIIEDIKILYQVSLAEKNIQINTFVNKLCIIYADFNMINTIFRNLISNAIKFTRQNGEIQIATKQQNDFAIISVKDNGVGIHEDRIKKLFTIEKNFSTPGTNNEKGSGLGLILCSEFVKKHGGEMKVESIMDEGSTFSFSIPHKNSD